MKASVDLGWGTASIHRHPLSGNGFQEASGGGGGGGGVALFDERHKGYGHSKGVKDISGTNA